MSSKSMRVGPSAMHALALRLEPGQDLRLALEDCALQHEIRAAFVLSCAGSLRRAALRYSGQACVTVLEARFEIVALSGSVSPRAAHLHTLLADELGSVRGGHVSAGCIVYTTAEIMLGVLDDVEFSRAHDPRTGYPELIVKSRVN